MRTTWFDRVMEGAVVTFIIAAVLGLVGIIAIAAFATWKESRPAVSTPCVIEAAP